MTEHEEKFRWRYRDLRKMTQTDKEKLEAIQQVVDEISSKQLRSKHTLYLDDTALLIDLERQIKEILEK